MTMQAPPLPAPWEALEEEIADALTPDAPGVLLSASPPLPSPPTLAAAPPPVIAQPAFVAPVAPSVGMPPPPPAMVGQTTPTAPVAQPEAPAAPQMVPAQQMVPAAPVAPPAVQAQETQTVNVSAMAAEEGFEGLEFDAFGTFPTISLKRGSFKTSSGEDLGQSFEAIITSSRSKFLFKTRLPDNDPRSDVAYTYDKQSSNGKDLQGILNGWATNGIGYEEKKYLELSCTLRDGRMMLLSVPPTSISRFSAFTAERLMKRKPANETIVRVGIAPEVTGPNIQFPWNPLSFSIVN